MMKLLGILLLIAGGYVAIFNWTAPLLSRRYRRNISIVPLVGAGLLAMGMLCLKVPTRYFWIPFVADYSTLMLLLVIPWLFHETWATSRFCRTRQFVALDRGRDIHIDLFRSGRALIRCAFNNTADDHFPTHPMAFSWVAQWRGGSETFEIYGYGGERRLTLKFVDGVFESAEECETEGTDLVCDTLSGIQFTDQRNA